MNETDRVDGVPSDYNRSNGASREPAMRTTEDIMSDWRAFRYNVRSNVHNLESGVSQVSKEDIAGVRSFLKSESLPDDSYAHKLARLRSEQQLLQFQVKKQSLPVTTDTLSSL